MNNGSARLASGSRWTLVGLAIALFALPLLALAFRAVFGAATVPVVLARESSIAVAALLLIWIVRSRERLPLTSIGLRAAPAGRFALWTLIGLAGCALAVAAGLLAVNLLGLRFGAAPGAVRVELPLWVTLLVVLRAGIVEELFYRGYAIERLQQLTGSKAVAVGLPLAVFAAFHYTQGAGGVLLSLLLGAVLTALYLWKRNLWVVMLVHFLVDFLPNIVLPLLSG